MSIDAPPAPAQPIAGTGPAAPKKRRRRTGHWTPLWLLIPAGGILAVIIGWPLIQLAIMSLQEYGREQVFGKPPEFVWFDNYIAVLTDGAFWAVLGRSLAFMAVTVVLTMTLGILIAVLMSKLNRFFRILVSVGLLLAWAMPALTATIVWGWMFDTRYGVLNWVITQVTGVDFIGHQWLIEPLSFFAVAVVIVTWQSVPFVAFTVFAGLSQIPGEVLEAAQLDGATGMQRFRLVTVPYIRAILLVVVILQVIWDMRVFTQIYALQDLGGVRNQTSTIGVYIYTESLGKGDYGMGGAIAIILVVIMMAISAYYVRSTLRQEES